MAKEKLLVLHSCMIKLNRVCSATLSNIAVSNTTTYNGMHYNTWLILPRMATYTRSVGFNAGPANATPAIVAMYIISGCGRCPL